VRLEKVRSFNGWANLFSVEYCLDNIVLEIAEINLDEWKCELYYTVEFSPQQMQPNEYTDMPR
jgi:hypothetical protein